ncbi:MAG: class I SAM-dependent methyltransferase [Myxococcales bacterium]|jgi:SAM-dependent methyltransferase|nr:class I SAM-dependent methyltransferase [Myxococcales bacterium]
MRKTERAEGFTIDACRSCGSSKLTSFLDLGTTPLADRLLAEDELGEPELVAPLDVVLCEDCSLVQITETVSPEILFCRNYPYFSSVSKALMEHFGGSARQILEERQLGASSLVVEAASNDGYMLKHFVEAGIPVLGIDPADGPAKKAQESGVRTLNTFFTNELAEELFAQGNRADVFLANNVLAHVADLNGFTAGVARLLKDDGVAVIECPYLLDLIEHCEFDTIYHQHLCYFSITALVNLFRRHGLSLNKVVRTTIHGGSLRLFIEKTEKMDASVTSLLEREKALGVDALPYYESFAFRVEKLKTDLIALLEKVKGEGKRIAGYGAAAKGCTLLSYCGVDSKYLDYIVDLNPVKQGQYFTGTTLKIEPPEKLLEDKPDAVMIIAWNFAKEIMKQQQAYRDQGGFFIIPVPEVRVAE